MVECDRADRISCSRIIMKLVDYPEVRVALGGATRLSSLRDRRDYQPSWRWRIRWHAAIAVSSELLARQILVGRLDLAVIIRHISVLRSAPSASSHDAEA